jgi:hypothetical protein
MCLSQRVGKEFLRSAFFAAERFLKYYERHDCSRLNRLHVVPREELVKFLDERTRPERDKGLDLTIRAFEMAEFLVTNHDGDLWFRRPLKWPAAEERHAEAGAGADGGA